MSGEYIVIHRAFLPAGYIMNHFPYPEININNFKHIMESKKSLNENKSEDLPSFCKHHIPI